MALFKVRYVKRRKRKGGYTDYYWVPTPKMQACGFRTVRLSNNLPEAIELAEKYNEEWDAHRLNGIPAGAMQGSVAWVIKQYTEDEAFIGLAARSQKDYKKHLEKLERWAGDLDATSITRKIAKEYYKACQEKLGARQSQYRMQVARRLYSFALDEGYVTENPFTKMRLKTPKPRTQVWKEKDITAIKEVAPQSIRNAVILAEYTGQRVEDNLTARLSQYDGESIEVVQGKTGVFVSIHCLPELKSMLDGLPEGQEFIITNENTNRPYPESTFDKVFAKAREQAGVDSQYQYRDFRRTAVVKLGRAGATTLEISSITGHSIEDCQRILDTYFPKDKQAGFNAMKKLEKHQKWNKPKNKSGTTQL